MFFAYALVNTAQGKRSELCIIPRKVTSETPPVPIHDLISSECAVYYIGGDEVNGHEAIAVRSLKEESGIEIKPVRPCVLYITPHNPDRPGERAELIVVKLNKDSEMIVQVKKGTSDELTTFNPGPRFFSAT